MKYTLYMHDYDSWCVIPADKEEEMGKKHRWQDNELPEYAVLVPGGYRFTFNEYEIEPLP